MSFLSNAGLELMSSTASQKPKLVPIPIPAAQTSITGSLHKQHCFGWHPCHVGLNIACCNALPTMQLLSVSLRQLASYSSYVSGHAPFFLEPCWSMRASATIVQLSWG
eukprot:scpid73792/ scgid8802/ 